ncbi:MAG: polysaccharide deacetylase family protein, partial [Bacteroidota bacterium]
MKKWYVFLLLGWLACADSPVQNDQTPSSDTPDRWELCITIDDLPVVTRQRGDSVKAQITRKLLHNLKQYQAPAIGFVNEGKMYDRKTGELSAFQKDLLIQWLDAGMQLGNHTLTHPSYHRTEFEAYAKEIKDGETVTKALLAERNQQLLYFRHPFLQTGNSQEKKEKLEQFLAAEGYVTAPVTIDNSDWIYAAAYDKAIIERDSSMMRRIGESFVNYIENKFIYFEGQSRKLFDRNIAHTLLLHANSINADYLDDLLERLQQRGYKFVHLAKALEDPAYQSESTYISNGGISWLDRWALTRGKNKIAHFFRDEPL